VYKRTQGNFSYSGGDAVMNFATQNGMLVRGHTLVWHAQTPSWVESLNREQMLAAMKNHINNVMGNWKGKILEWDVVNEAVSAGANSMWQKIIGTGFIDSAFVYAHQADPAAYLYYND
jgi:endo-1,4-beta-xylanase